MVKYENPEWRPHPAGTGRQAVVKYENLEWRPHPAGTGRQALVNFPNGYVASIIETGFAYGGRELAVMYDGSCVYDTPITGDVVGWLTPEQVDELLVQIENLPPRKK